MANFIFQNLVKNFASSNIIVKALLSKKKKSNKIKNLNSYSLFPLQIL